MHKSVNSKTLHSTLSLGFLNFVSVLITCVCIEDGTLKMIVTCNVVAMVCVVGIGCDIQPSTLTLTHSNHISWSQESLKERDTNKVQHHWLFII